jgi:hypothetical protein
MTNSFRLIALPAERFTPFFRQTDAELESVGARRITVHEKPGYPCRVSLADGEVGETVLLMPFTHHDVPSPYRAAGPIFIREGAMTAEPEPDEIPIMFRHRLLSIRGYDAAAMMISAEVVKGADLEGTIRRHFVDESVSYLHIHNVGPGCYNCRVVRA